MGYISLSVGVWDALTGNPISGAWVTIIVKGADPHTAKQKQTGSNGVTPPFTLDTVPLYVIMVSKTGYQSASKEKSFTDADDGKVLSFTLKPVQPTPPPPPPEEPTPPPPTPPPAPGEPTFDITFIGVDKTEVEQGGSFQVLVRVKNIANTSGAAHLYLTDNGTEIPGTDWRPWIQRGFEEEHTWTVHVGEDMPPGSHQICARFR